MWHPSPSLVDARPHQRLRRSTAAPPLAETLARFTPELFARIFDREMSHGGT